MRWSTLVFTLLLCLPLAAQESVRPSGDFRYHETLQLLDDGDGVVRGTAFFDDKGRRRYPKVGEWVILTPLTEYYEECLSLAKAHPGKVVEIDPRASSVAYVTRTIDDQGHFLFIRLKPGRYLISSKVDWVGRGTERVEVARNVTYNWYGVPLGSVPLYEKRDFVYRDIRQVTGRVVLPTPGDIIEVEICEAD